MKTNLGRKTYMILKNTAFARSCFCLKLIMTVHQVEKVLNLTSFTDCVIFPFCPCKGQVPQRYLIVLGEIYH